MQHERMEMTHGMWCAHAKLTTWATRVRVIRCKTTRKCDVWGVLFTSPVGCSRLLSAVNDLTKKKSCKVSLLSSFVKKWHNGSHRSICCSFTSSDVLDFLCFLSSTSIATEMCWMKKTMDAIAGIARKESAKVALLQTLGEDSVI